MRVNGEATAGRDQPHSTDSPTYVNKADGAKRVEKQNSETRGLYLGSAKSVYLTTRHVPTASNSIAESPRVSLKGGD